MRHGKRIRQNLDWAEECEDMAIEQAEIVPTCPLGSRFEVGYARSINEWDEARVFRLLAVCALIRWGHS